MKKRNFKRLIDQNELNHAYLLNGYSFNEIEETMDWVMRYYYCQADKKPCDSCPNCKAILNHEFAGLTEINGEEQIIKIDQVRSMTSSADYSDIGQKAKFFVIKHAELMNENAQNALLKHLESPENDRYFFLLTRNMYLLLPTIISRCEVVYFGGKKLNVNDPVITEFVKLLMKRNPMAYVVLTTEMKTLIKENGIDFVVYAIKNAYMEASFSEPTIKDLGFFENNLPQVAYHLDFQRQLEKFCLEVLSED